MEKIFKYSGWWMAVVCCAAIVVSCKKNDLPPEPNENLEVNEWILENMLTEYYWNNTIPADPNMSLDPIDFFYSQLLNGVYTKENGNWEYDSGEDRFSWIQESADELTDELAGRFESFGYEMKLYYLREGSSDVGAVVLYTYSGSDAADNGLERGMWIGKVNGQALNDENYTILFDTRQAQELSVGQLDSEGNFVEEDQITVTAAEIQEDPIYLDSVYTYAGKKIGYVVYNSFIPSPAGDTAGVPVYDAEMRNIFSQFKGQGVNELVLDLRYNLGGAVSSACKLAGYIMKGYQDDNIFAIYEDNTESFPVPIDAFYDNQPPPNLGTLDRVYVLISSNTASASELIINGLKPYMEVVLVGDDRTVGKNVASQTIYDNRNIPDNQKIKYGLQPIVLKIYNSLGESDFEEGFVPDLEVFENYKPFGDVTESFLGEALNSITGGAVVTTEALRARPPAYGRAIGGSLERKPGAGRMYVKPGALPLPE